MVLVLFSFLAFLLLVLLFALELVAVFAYGLTKFGLIWCIAGLILAPLAGVATQSAVSSRGIPVTTNESPWRFGAMASACFVVPWIYVMVRIYHKSFHRSLRDSQVALFAYVYLALGPIPFLALCAFAALLLGAWLWTLIFAGLFIAATRAFCRYWTRRTEASDTDSEVRSLATLFRRECMVPFFMASLCTIAAFASFQAAIWAGIPDDFVVFFTLRSFDAAWGGTAYP